MILHVSDRQAELILDALYDISNSLTDVPIKGHSAKLYHVRVDRLIGKLNRQILTARQTKHSRARRHPQPPVPDSLVASVKEAQRASAQEALPNDQPAKRARAHKHVRPSS